MLPVNRLLPVATVNPSRHDPFERPATHQNKDCVSVTVFVKYETSAYIFGRADLVSIDIIAAKLTWTEPRNASRNRRHKLTDCAKLADVISFALVSVLIFSSNYLVLLRAQCAGKRSPFVLFFCDFDSDWNGTTHWLIPQRLPPANNARRYHSK